MLSSVGVERGGFGGDQFEWEGFRWTVVGVAAGLRKVECKTYGGMLADGLGEAGVGIGSQWESEGVSKNGVKAGSVLPVPLIGREI